MVKKLLIFLGGLIPVATWAGFQVVDEPAPPAATAAPAASPDAGRKPAAPSVASAAPVQPQNTGGLQLIAVTYVGEPDADISVVSGFGRDLKLVDAIKQIVPPDWQVFVKDNVVAKAGQSVSWRGGRRWVDVLDILASEHRVAIVVDWAKKSLYVGERQVVEAPKFAKGAAKPAVWVLREGYTVGRELQSWGKEAGWKVVWNLAKDWSIPSDTSFTGDFKTAAAEAIKTLADNGVIIRAQFYDGNNTMVVTGPGVAEQ